MLTFIKKFFEPAGVSGSKVRQYPEKLVDSDLDYRSKYEEQLRNEITFLKSLIAAGGVKGNSIPFSERLARPMEVDDLNSMQSKVGSSNLDAVHQPYIPFGSIRAQVEAKLRKNVKPPQD